MAAIDCTISGNYLEGQANTAIDFRDVQGDGEFKFVIEFNEFQYSGVGWMPIRIRSNNMDENDTVTVLVENNKFIETYIAGDNGEPQFLRDNAGNKIYTVGRNYYEVDGAPYVNLTDANFCDSAVSFDKAYSSIDEIPNQNEEEPEITGEDGLKALKMVIAANKSSKEHRPISLDELEE